MERWVLLREDEKRLLSRGNDTKKGGLTALFFCQLIDAGYEI